MDTKSHTRAMRDRLKAAREQRYGTVKYKSQAKVGELVGTERRALWLAADPADRSKEEPTGEAYSDRQVDNWERLHSNPPIDVYAAWARSLDHRLVMDVVPRAAAPEMTSAMVPRMALPLVHELVDLTLEDAEEVVRLARLLTTMEPGDRVFVVDLIERLGKKAGNHGNGPADKKRSRTG